MSDNHRRQPSQATSPAETWPEKMKMSEAHRFLGVSHAKITCLVKTGVIPYELNPLDHRIKLIKKSDLEKLRQAVGRS
jgi:hypothetical protein